jgi:hypothetical protein
MTRSRRFSAGNAGVSVDVDDLALSICAVLAAEGCNIGIEPLVKSRKSGLDLRKARLGAAELTFGPKR